MPTSDNRVFLLMKELKEYFTGRGEVKEYIFNQVLRSPYCYIYEVKGLNGGVHYEVFKRKENTLYDCVSYPTSKAFGKWAWTYDNLDKAIERFDQVESEERNRILS